MHSRVAGSLSSRAGLGEASFRPGAVFRIKLARVPCGGRPALRKGARPRQPWQNRPQVVDDSPAGGRRACGNAGRT